jgi:hypothetical protein
MSGAALMSWFAFAWAACAALLAAGAIFSRLALNSVAVLDGLLSEENEDDKLDLVQSRTALLTKSLLAVVAFIGAIITLGIALEIALNWALGEGGVFGSGGRSLGWELLAGSLGALPPWIRFSRRNARLDFSPLSVLLHRIAFDHPNLSWRLFKQDLKGRGNIPSRPDFLLITGLARSGTTSMLNHISRVERFDSLSYANLPFLLAPNLWRRLYNPAQGEAVERSHKDGVLIHHRSVEALEEYFFKVITRDGFIHEDRLVPHDISSKQAQDYLDYQRVVRSGPEKIYLAKNNNALLRYSSLRQLNADFRAVILFRHPLYHAASLLSKHLQYGKLHIKDPFVNEMMDWLGHHEFGRGHKPMAWTGTAAGASAELPTGLPTTLDYWIEVWIQYHGQLLAIDDTCCLWVDYANFCARPSQVIEQVLAPWGEKWDFEQIAAFDNTREIKQQHNPALLKRALQLYAELQEKSMAQRHAN